MRIVIAGYYGFGNAGDELILSCILSHLQSRLPGSECCVLSADPSATSTDHKLAASSRWNPFSVLGQIWSADCLLLGGGGLLQNGTSQSSLLYYLALVAAARVLQTPVVLYALGVESLGGDFSKRLVKWILDSPEVKITVRDKASQDALAAVGIERNAVHITADPVFSLGRTEAPRERYEVHLPSALLIPRFPCPPEGRRTFAVIGRILKEQKSVMVRGLLFQAVSESRFLDFFDGESILSKEDFICGLSSEQMVRSVASHDWVVSARFHGLVLAALAGRPFIGVGDEHKVGRLCKELGMPFLRWNAGEAEILAAVEKMLLKSFNGASEILTRLRDASLRTAEFVS